ncbi:hypothetical protein HPB52_001793 [Rhipicephalus sanguineus]|uniref:Uncharacterized protein n=1 Tax=Rhipicephalus sanguineus TaxID=34632 RepID=A0A9D4QCV9_RHISA|nr:hypothetical protein HPB52_001793 [Rhipicephalus sanguineus]
MQAIAQLTAGPARKGMLPADVKYVRNVVTAVTDAPKVPGDLAAFQASSKGKKSSEFLHGNALEESPEPDKELEKAKKPQKGYYGKKVRKRKLVPGDQVLVLLPADTNKLVLSWQGPFPVVEKRSMRDYPVNLGDKTQPHVVQRQQPVQTQQSAHLGCIQTPQQVIDFNGTIQQTPITYKMAPHQLQLPRKQL